MAEHNEKSLKELLSDVREYFRTTGWKRVQHPNNRVHVYTNQSKFGDLELFLPSSHEYVDSNRRIISVIETLTELSGQSIDEFLAGMQRHNKDALLFRIHTQLESDSVPLEYAEVQISGMKKLMTYAAASEAYASPYHTRAPAEATQLTEQCEFGHTFRGSFGFSILLRVLMSEESAEIFDSPFRRRVFERIGHGLNSISNAKKEKSVQPIVQNYEKGLNSRMCDALAEISADGRCDYSVNIDWASVVTPPSNLLDLPSVEITPEVVDLLKQASLDLKHVPPREYLVKGYVSNLHCIKDPMVEDANRKIEIVHDHEEYGRIEVGIVLSKDNYLKATEAHTSRKEIQIKGVLQRIGASWSLGQIEAFRVLESDST